MTELEWLRTSGARRLCTSADRHGFVFDVYQDAPSIGTFQLILDGDRFFGPFDSARTARDCASVLAAGGFIENYGTFGVCLDWHPIIT